MTQTYRISGMSCEHCVKSVRQALESIEEVESAEVTLDPPVAIVYVNHPVPNSVIDEALGSWGNYKIGEE